MNKKRYRLEKLSHRKTGFPIGTIAYYGPDDQFASKVVVGIVESESSDHQGVDRLKKWFAHGTDVRQDMTILEEMLKYLEENHVQRVGMYDRIIGCPHEEGIDYSEGETCPQCPFWAHRDRWTGEIID